MIPWNAAGIPILKRLIPSLNRRWAEWTWRHGVRPVRFRGALWLLAHRNRVDRDIAFYGDYEKPQLDRFLARLSEGDIDLFLDVGANFGLYAVLAAIHAPGARIVAFEPDPRNRDQLAAHRWLNPSARRIEIDGRAVSAAAGTVAFRFYPDGSTGQSRIAEDGATIDCVALDDLFPIEGRTIMLKIDVEGHESAALAGARRLLSQNRCWLQIEIWPEREAAVTGLLSELGYRPIATENQDWTFVGGSSK